MTAIDSKLAEALFPFSVLRPLRASERRFLQALQSGRQVASAPRRIGKTRLAMRAAAFRYGNVRAVQLRDLVGPALAWAVAIVEGHTPTLSPGAYGSLPRVVVTLRGQSVDRQVVFRPDRDWATAGPLLDEWLHGFGVKRAVDGLDYRAFAYDPNGVTMRLAGGPTLLITACRARVRNVFGDVVHVPEALV